MKVLIFISNLCIWLNPFYVLERIFGYIYVKIFLNENPKKIKKEAEEVI